jgi:hypothetical protein
MSETPAAEPVNVYELLSMMLDSISSVAWAKLGLRPDPLTGEMAPDMEMAKAAVDASAALGAIIEPQLDGEDKRTIQNLIRDLKVNYVQRSQA